jgi:hypothetical protein
MSRRKNDFYPTPSWATEELLRHVTISGKVFECCAGNNAMAQVLERDKFTQVLTNDVDPAMPSHVHRDATEHATWSWLPIKPDWVVTNPPFNKAIEIVRHAFEHAQVGIAMMLRLSFLEPVESRGEWLNQNPPHRIIVLPRISFTGNGKTDNVTVAWMVWYADAEAEIGELVDTGKYRFPPNQYSQILENANWSR